MGGIYGRNQEEIHGRSAHGSAPDQGKDAIVAAAAVVMGLQTLSSRVNDPQNTFVLTVGMMNGGTQSNIIADEVELVGTTRAFDKAFHNGEGKEEAASPPQKEANPASLRSAAPSKGRGSRGHSLLPMEGGAPKGRRLDGDSGMKESEEMHLKSTINESTLSTADAVPLPQWGRLRYEDTAFLASSKRI